MKKVVRLKILKIKRAVEEEKTVKLYALVNVQMLFFSVLWMRMLLQLTCVFPLHINVDNQDVLALLWNVHFDFATLLCSCSSLISMELLLVWSGNLLKLIFSILLSWKWILCFCTSKTSFYDWKNIFFSAVFFHTYIYIYRILKPPTLLNGLQSVNQIHKTFFLFSCNLLFACV